MAYLGVDNAYIQEQQASWVALESHTIFNCELQLADPLRVTAQVLDADSKRIHLFQTMMHVEQEFRAATNELMILHVDLERRRSSPFPDAVIERVRRIAVAHRGLPRPPEQGRAIGLRKGVR